MVAMPERFKDKFPNVKIPKKEERLIDVVYPSSSDFLFI